MTHRTEDGHPLERHIVHVATPSTLLAAAEGSEGVCIVLLPIQMSDAVGVLPGLFGTLGTRLGKRATLVTLGSPRDLVYVHTGLVALTYQLWISIKRSEVAANDRLDQLPTGHFGAIVHTRYGGTLRHTRTRIAYTYCPACNKTTKDYGGKKHTYNSYGTLISDVWTDISANPHEDLSVVIDRLIDLFSLEEYTAVRVIDARQMLVTAPLLREEPPVYHASRLPIDQNGATEVSGRLLNGDSLEQLSGLADNSVDFAFIDPPYNLGKNYNSYSDDLDIQRYFEWCDAWIAETARVLKPGRTLAILNIPLWATRHFLFMDTMLTFQNWIVWDALSFPVRKIMPANYAIVCFSKGTSRALPGLVAPELDTSFAAVPQAGQPLRPLADLYCVRASCISRRNAGRTTDRVALTDLWTDIHRLKHNSRRVDHPCQLPPQLLYRLITLFTQRGETVLDCFNGAGTTTLAAHQLGRSYVGIELATKYHEMALARHAEIERGIDPFRKQQRALTEKNSRVPRVKQQTYAVPKKTLQLEVRRIAKLLGHMPTRAEVEMHGSYPIQYYDDYFVSWGEATAAARHDGMSDVAENERATRSVEDGDLVQLSLFDRGTRDAKR